MNEDHKRTRRIEEAFHTTDMPSSSQIDRVVYALESVARSLDRLASKSLLIRAETEEK